jgi:hypothetical protein
MTFRKENEAEIAKEIYGEGWKEGEIWYDDLDEEGESFKVVHFYEANYAFYSELETLRGKNIPFIVTHGDGGDYSASAIVSFDNAMHEQITNCHGDLLVRVDEDGIPMVSDVEKSVAFANAQRAAEKFLSMDISKLGFYSRRL